MNIFFKQIKIKFQYYITKKLLRSFIADFAKKDNWHELDIGKANLGYGLIHYSLIRSLRLKNILCIGSKYGFIPAICALACKHNGKGKVDFVDANYNEYIDVSKQHWGGRGYWKTTKSKKNIKKYDLNKYLTLHIMTSKQFKKKYKNKKWEYIYIDGDHSYDGVKLDFNLFWYKLNHGGFMLFHDLFSKNTSKFKYGVNKLWQELKKEKKLNMFEIQGKCGLGIIQKI